MKKRVAWMILVFACICFASLLAALLAYREHWLNTEDIVSAEQWPQHLTSFVDEARADGDPIDDIDVRRTGLICTYYWRMAAKESRLNRHIQHFGLESVPVGGVEQERVLRYFPHAWKHPTAISEVYAFPPGLPGTGDGEFEFVMLHDEASQTIYFYYYFDF